MKARKTSNVEPWDADGSDRGFDDQDESDDDFFEETGLANPMGARYSSA